MTAFLDLSPIHALRTSSAVLLLCACPALAYQAAKDTTPAPVETLNTDTLRQEATASKSDAGSGDAEEEASPVYVPPRLGAPSTRVGGGTRGGSANVPQIALLSPEHTGLTQQASPTLYWYLARDYTGVFEFVVTARDSVVPELRLRAEGRQVAGIHALDLAEHGITLQRGRLYQWSVSIVRDENHRSRDVVGVATIERLSADDTPIEHDAVHLAAAGLWYDAVEATSRSIAQTNEQVHARAARAALLEQVGLNSAAAWDRAL